MTTTWQAMRSRLAWTLLVAVAAAAAAGFPHPALAQAAAAEPLPAGAYFARPEMASPMLSPSGRYLALLVRGTQERNALAVLDLQNTGQSKVLVRFSDVDINSVRWVGDQHLVFNVIDLQAGSGDRQLAPGLFVVDRDGSNYRELVKLRPDPLVTDGGRGPDRRLDYNHVLLDVASDSEDEIILGEVQFGNDRQVQNVLPLRLNVKTRVVRRPWPRVPTGTVQWLFDPQGEPRLAVSVEGPRTRFHWREPGQDGWKLLADGRLLNLPWQPYAVDSQGTLYVRMNTGAGGTSVLSRFDFAAGRPEAQPIVSTPGYDFQGSLIIDRASGRMLGARVTLDAEETVWLDPDLKAVQADVDRRLPGRVNRISCAPCAGDKRVLLIESYADRDPGTFLVWRNGAARPDLIGNRLKLDVQRMASMSAERIRARDGRDLPVWITQPPGLPPGTRAPAVVLVHGGPWVRGSAWGWHAMPQFLASRGYVVIEPEFRGSAGYGAEHLQAGWRQWGQAMQDDVADAVNWAAREKLIDPGRVCIAGASYGGYATLMGLVRQPELYRCGAAWVAVTDLMRLVEGSFWWRDDVSDAARRYTIPTMVGDAQADRSMLLANSPLERAGEIRAPLLLAYGGADERVPLVHGKDLRAALRKAGNEPEWIVYDEEGHGWRRQANQVDFAKRLEAFLAKHLK